MRVLKIINKFMWDVSGAFGDIGLLFPLSIALITKNHFNPTALFLMAGLFYILSSYYFKITMPVQPLKAIAVIAIAKGLGSDIINTSGMEMGIILLFIAFTGLSVKLGRIFPVSVVRGIQLGLGLLLVKASLHLMNKDISIAVIAVLILIACIFVFKKIPPLIPIMILGIVFSLKGIKMASLGYIPLSTRMPANLNELWRAFIVLVLPQLALTFGNAVVATEATGKALYGQRAQRLNFKSIPTSMGVANIISGILGGVPMCHGSGGVTAHYKFGATSERSGYIIGFTLITLAILFGHSSLSIISAFPNGILGVSLFYVGVQHSLYIRDIFNDRIGMFVALVTAIFGFFTTNLTLGFLVGLAIYYMLTRGLNKGA